ncbi:AMP-binding protein [Quisquiliibacterium transsilvanicum]|uniref:Acyl-CoA synthetase (AMP-forming)/AMP-acid ligase II/D-alanine-D-alanine ligase-like ATP-grasp enzyme n=1 Tax=Quisquiliibacterium transsilvanicum TaxID=1549638 RepID=A0A7W8HI19_9BURK|nr:AMP-binding protein [Quisquiliibacterium transsilvanicum]MBB5271673.1 acyl-CoA synthetase (AMP-forming)/AMP-acid ligase II/D-alanine-D-alanine ligase-like ATP-grasp enzyme [Quisquiliibacterium transsilvanicum]
MTRNFTTRLAEHARHFPAAVALAHRGGDYTYAQVDAAVWTAAAGIHAAGVRPGMRVGLTCVDQLGYALAMLAVCRLGASCVSLPPGDPVVYREDLARRLALDFILVDRQANRLPGFRGGLVDCAWGLREPGDPVDRALEDPAPPAPCQIIVGSGSTGRKKLIPVGHEALIARASIFAGMIGMTEHDRVACLSPLDFAMCNQRLFEAIWLGAAFVVLEPLSNRTVDELRSARVSVLHASVFHAQHMLRGLPDSARDVLGFLRVLRIGSATVTETLRRRAMRQLTQNLFIRLGANDCGPITIARPADIASTPGTVGRPCEGVDLRLTGPDGAPVAAGEVGQIWMRSPGMVEAYIDDREANAAAFRDGWFTTHDLGRLTPDGQLIYCGRADDMIVYNGINIHPAEVENAMSGYPGVADVVCVPYRVAEGQALPACVIAFQAGREAPREDLARFAAERLGPQRPRQIVVVDAIPRTETGKLVRDALIVKIRSALAPRMRNADDEGARQSVAVDAARPVGLDVARPDGPQGMLQRFALLRPRFAVPRAEGIERLSRSISEVLSIEPGPGDADARALDETGLAAAFADRVARVARLFLELGRLPVFDPPRVVSLECSGERPRACAAALAFPVVENVPLECQRIALQSALQFCNQACAGPLGAEARESLLQAISSGVVAQLRRLVPAGASTIPVLRVAHELGIPYIHLGAGVYQLGWGSRARRMDRSITDRDSAIGARLSQDKMVAAGLLRMAGLPAPVHAAVQEREGALRAARELGYPLVVKPSDRDRGEGVTVDVADEASLLAAFDEARALARNRRAIVERQVPGVCHRLFVAGGRLLYAVKRLPMSVRGDGRSNVAELVDAELARQRSLPPWQRTEIRPIDDLALAAMAREGFAPTSIPADGTLVPLRRIESSRWGGVDEAVSDRVHPDNLAIALRGAALFGLDVAGIDIITPDIAVPWHRNGAIVNEVNIAPLFGGGEISKAHIGGFLKAFVDGDGRIPVEYFDGADAIARARARFAELRAAGRRCFVTSAVVTLDAGGAPLQLETSGLEARMLALACRPDVDAILAVRSQACASDTGADRLQK